MKKNVAFILSLCFLTVSLVAQIPAGYYTSATGKSNAELKTALHQIIEVGTRLSYGSGSGSTWSGFAKSDLHPDGYAWDMYSLQKRAFSSTSTSAPSGMNIEHSVAKSWWGGTNNDAYKDLYHLNPSDKDANSARGSYPLGINSGGTWSNGSIKVGKNTYGTEYTGICFEPLDEYKGDFARAYMYMFTCYEDLTWTGTSAPTMLNANEKWPMLKNWAKNLLLAWHRQDPVSEKERKRLAEIYKLQRNRNPFIDYPELVEHLWGNRVGQPWNAEGGDYPYISSPVSGTKIDFGKVAYLQTATSAIQIKAHNLTGNVSMAISGTHAANFSLSATTLTKAQAEAGHELTIHYSAQSVGAQTAVLTVSGGVITPTTIPLSALSSDEFMAFPADAITASGFRANWSVSAAATGYVLHVYKLESNGATETKTIVEEEFQSGLPTGWTAEGYTDNQTAGNIRLASGSNAGKINTPALNLTAAGNVLTVRARQYSNDTGAQLTAKIDGETLAQWSTQTTNNTFTVNIPQGTASSVISLSANSGSRVYVDYVKVQTQGSVQSPVSVAGFPKSVGNTLTYIVDGLQNNSTYYYKVTPEGNSASTSNQIPVNTIISSTDYLQNNPVSWYVLPNGIRLVNLPANCRIILTDLMGKRLQTIESDKPEQELNLSKRGIYLLQIQFNQELKSIKILF